MRVHVLRMRGHVRTREKNIRLLLTHTTMGPDGLVSYGFTCCGTLASPMESATASRKPITENAFINDYCCCCARVREMNATPIARRYRNSICDRAKLISYCVFFVS